MASKSNREVPTQIYGDRQKRVTSSIDHNADTDQRIVIAPGAKHETNPLTEVEDVYSVDRCKSVSIDQALHIDED